MNEYNIELFNTWAPEESPWSAWAKPVLFAQERHNLKAAEWSAAALRADMPLRNVARAASSPRQAVVVDLPGVETMRAAAQLALAGYRPVPLFNTTRGPVSVRSREYPIVDADNIVSVDDILAALGPVAEIIREARLDASAPPAFLLDAKRNPFKPNSITDAGKFDNRWMVFPQDFPSAGFLGRHGIERVVLHKEGAPEPAEDLAHVLLRWQETGVPVYFSQAGSRPDAPPLKLLTVTKPWEYRSWVRRLMVLLKLRRNSAGGFGAMIPRPDSGGGGWG